MTPDRTEFVLNEIKRLKPCTMFALYRAVYKDLYIKELEQIMDSLLKNNIIRYRDGIVEVV